METSKQQRKRIFMWHQVTELLSQGFNKSQISVELGIDRSTVRRYLSFSEDEFYHFVEQGRHLPHKLDQYYKEVQKLLEGYPYLSCAQVEDRLKEKHPDLPSVHSKTVYNFVQRVRHEQGIAKESSAQVRQYENLPALAYGHQGQVDWGQYHMLKRDGGRQTVYFMVMLLSRSRQKYVYFSDYPFTTNLTIEAHNLAFTYFEGQPKELLYDQDRVLVVDENLGDIILTKEFSTYCSEMAFKAVFCRKADPESKGKVENVVQFVKKNFLRGREFESIDKLNASCLEWLIRTGNGKEHATTQKVPHQEWLIEKDFLLALPAGLLTKREPQYQSYNVRKDNTISYHGNYYTLPLGTYQSRDSRVLIRAGTPGILFNLMLFNLLPKYYYLVSSDLVVTFGFVLSLKIPLLAWS